MDSATIKSIQCGVQVKPISDAYYHQYTKMASILQLDGIRASYISVTASLMHAAYLERLLIYISSRNCMRDEEMN